MYLGVWDASVNEYLHNSAGSIAEVKTALAHSLQLL